MVNGGCTASLSFPHKSQTSFHAFSMQHGSRIQMPCLLSSLDSVKTRGERIFFFFHLSCSQASVDPGNPRVLRYEKLPSTVTPFPFHLVHWPMVPGIRRGGEDVACLSLRSKIAGKRPFVLLTPLAFLCPLWSLCGKRNIKRNACTKVLSLTSTGF